MKKTSIISLLRLKGILLFFGATALLLVLLTFNENHILGLFGYVLRTVLRFCFGLCSLLIPIFFFWVSFQYIQNKEVSFKKKGALFSLLLTSLSLIFSLTTETFPQFASLFKNWIYSGYYPKSDTFDPTRLRHYLGGVPIHYLYSDIPFINLKTLIGKTGVLFAALSLLLTSSFFLFDAPFHLFKKAFLFVKEKWKKKDKTLSKIVEEPIDESLLRAHPMTAPKERPIFQKKEKVVEEIAPTPIPQVKKDHFSNYTFPATSLLTAIKKKDTALLKNDLKRQAEVLEETLLSFGIEAKVGDIHSGPTITSFEVHPAVGVKVQKIKALENDIALNMQAKAIRIIAPIPGKAAVGIELPNLHPQEVSFREGIENYQNGQKKCRIPLILGKTVNGDDIVTDLVKTPHMLIAGATGSGKSVCINTIVMSILMNTHPDEVKFVMVDPKKVELSSYSPLPHMLAPVITEADEARSALLYLVREMEKRYELFRKLSHRNIESFNNRKPNKELESSMEEEVPKHLPYIVLIIDEFADLIMVSTSDMETPIARIAQMARAVGIHMILATQRPSREVITGLIKANFPSRIAFKVASRVNSQIILDDCGAESLLGNGDLLFLPPGSSHLIRAQGVFIRDEDIHNVIDFVKNQAPANYLITSFQDFAPLGGETEETSSDSLYTEAKNLVLETGNASTTFLQRKLKIGYARAASLMDELEKNRIIGPQEGAKPRKIYYPED